MVEYHRSGFEATGEEEADWIRYRKTSVAMRDNSRKD